MLNVTEIPGVRSIIRTPSNYRKVTAQVTPTLFRVTPRLRPTLNHPHHRQVSRPPTSKDNSHLQSFLLTLLSGCVHHQGNVEFPAQLPPRATTSVTSNVMNLSISETTLHPDYIVIIQTRAKSSPEVSPYQRFTRGQAQDTTSFHCSQSRVSEIPVSTTTMKTTLNHPGQIFH